MPSSQGRSLRPADEARLIRKAIAARRQAYAPYSHYRVGAALLTRSGKVYAGCNVENASFGLTVCAERVALLAAAAAGERDVVALAVVTANGGSPCGACRQVLSEFGRDDTIVLIADARGRSRLKLTMDELLPARFRRGHLPQ